MAARLSLPWQNRLAHHAASPPSHPAPKTLSPSFAAEPILLNLYAHGPMNAPRLLSRFVTALLTPLHPAQAAFPSNRRG